MAGRTEPKATASPPRAPRPTGKPIARKARPAVSKEKAKVIAKKMAFHAPPVVKSPGRRTTPPGVMHIPFDVLDFRRAYSASPIDRMVVIRTGIPATSVNKVAKRFNISQEELMARLGMSKSTISRKAKEGGRLTPEQSERLLGMAKLVGQVEAIIEESGDPETSGEFNAAAWLEDWLSRPNPALGNVLPSTYLDTHEGREVLSRLIAQMQSGAYA